MAEEETPAPTLVGTESTIETSSEQYNSATALAQRFHEEVNTAYNHHVIIGAMLSGRAADIGDETKPELINGEKPPCIIIGSGPSLDHSIQYLKDWKGGIICTTSHALTLMRYGIEPTHLFSLDPFDQWSDIAGVDWSKTRTTLVCQPGCWPDLIANWPNRMLLYIENNGKPDSFYATTQKRMYSHREGPEQRRPTFHFYIKTELTLFACSPPAQLFAAEVLGYGTIFLCGVDFGFSMKKDRFTNWTPNPDGTWTEHPHPFVDGPTVIWGDNGMPSAHVHIYYKKNFLSAWSLCQKTIYTTGQGIMTEIPYVDIKKVIRKQGLGFEQQDKQFIADHTEAYLAKVGAFIVETDRGKMFIESKKPLEELPNYMAGIDARYHCDDCKGNFANPDGIDHTGDQCPQCKTGKVIKDIHVDIKANMERIAGYLKKAGKL